MFKSKNRHRKKNKKDLTVSVVSGAVRPSERAKCLMLICVSVFQSVIVLSSMRGGQSRDEDEEDELFPEEDAL